MKAVLFAVLLAAFCSPPRSVLVAGDAIIASQVKFLSSEIKRVYGVLAAECPSYIIVKRQLINPNHPASLEIQKTLYTNLLTLLIRCRKGKPAIKVTIPAQDPTRPRTTVAAVKPTAVSSHLLSLACKTAENYTQEWRRDYKGSNIKPGGYKSKLGYACDQAKPTDQWFRFTGKAGNRLLSTCPQKYSCGTAHPFWTDEIMPKDVGVPKKIKVYGVVRQCKSLTRELIVMRCSSTKEHDYIYQQTSKYTTACQAAYCGMI